MSTSSLTSSCKLMPSKEAGWEIEEEEDDDDDDGCAVRQELAVEIEDENERVASCRLSSIKTNLNENVKLNVRNNKTKVYVNYC